MRMRSCHVRKFRQQGQHFFAAKAPATNRNACASPITHELFERDVFRRAMLASTPCTTLPPIVVLQRCVFVCLCACMLVCVLCMCVVCVCVCVFLFVYAVCICCVCAGSVWVVGVCVHACMIERKHVRLSVLTSVKVFILHIHSQPDVYTN